MVTKIKEIGNLSQEIKNALMNYKFNQNELNIFMKIFNELSLQVRYASIMKDGVSLSAIQRNGENFDLTNMHFKKYTIKYEEDFKVIANAIFSKIYEAIQ